MVQAIPAVVAAFGTSAAAVTAYSIINTILINIALGALEYESDDGTTWAAADE